MNTETESKEEYGSKKLPTNNDCNNKLLQRDLPKFLQSFKARFGQDIELDNFFPKILLSSMSYRHPSFEYPNEGTKANSLETCLQPVRPTAPKCRHNHFRAHQEHADGIGVVFMCTLVLIANFVTCHRSLDGDPQQHQCGWAMPTSGD